MDEQEISKLKRLAAGPAGEMQSKFPLLFAKPIIFGERPGPGKSALINTATVTLVDLGQGPFGITCAHVVNEYFRRLHEYANPIFQVGGIEVPIGERVLSIDEKNDLVTISLTEEEAMLLKSQGEIGSCFYKPTSWPPKVVERSQYVSFGGFPGSLREIATFDEVELASWSCGASIVSSVSEEQFLSAFEREYWVKSFGASHNMHLRDLGGMSGGPVFVDRTLYRELVGIVSAYHENYDAMFFSKIARIKLDGSIQKNII